MESNLVYNNIIIATKETVYNSKVEGKIFTFTKLEITLNTYLFMKNIQLGEGNRQCSEEMDYL